MAHGTVHVFDYLENDTVEVPQGICVLFGSERFLKQLATHAMIASGNDYSVSRMDGATARLADVLDELSTQSLFGGGGPKVVVLDEADAFVKENRSTLETFAQSQTSGLLLLVVDKWASNTNLYKLINKSGLQLRCDPPAKGKSKQPDTKRIAQWLVQRADQVHDFSLPANGAQLLIELTDCEFGRMDQELQKLALYADKKKKVSLETVQSAVGGWRTQTMWDAIAAACDGDAATALTLTDQLLKTGEHPLALFGQLSWSLRRYSTATEIVLRQARSGRRPDMSSAVSAAGFKPWGGEADLAQGRLKQLGRGRAAQILDWLNEADAALKRTHANDGRGRLVLEKLFTRMAKELSPG